MGGIPIVQTIGWWMAAGLFLFALGWFIFHSPVTLRGVYRRVGHDDEAEVHFRMLFGAVSYTFQLPKVQHRQTLNAKVANDWLAQIRKRIVITDGWWTWLSQLLSKTTVTEWKWRSEVGTRDAMWTALATGMVWAIKTTVIGILSQFVRLPEIPLMSVKPVYGADWVATELYFAAEMKFGTFAWRWLVLVYRVRGWIGLVKYVVRWQKSRKRQ